MNTTANLEKVIPFQKCRVNLVLLISLYFAYEIRASIPLTQSV